MQIVNPELQFVVIVMHAFVHYLRSLQPVDSNTWSCMQIFSFINREKFEFPIQNYVPSLCFCTVESKFIQLHLFQLYFKLICKSKVRVLRNYSAV